MKYGLDGNMNGKIEIVMRKVGLDPVSKKRVCNYSLGMRSVWLSHKPLWRISLF